ncbi:hypothetical protein A3193_10115 [Candidatus Thiodiazotropha endoloripes]|uniref:hypothetical protein n=1 Tax=Candidatus Thiodiazotropha endoloripes TaxID=1818881 RepID=UPI00083D7DEC|nr:hypothetical protein [Candidatus Thiodiazotropha endoloripes]MCG7915026.1 hypothetical protein [Candidatus Thiodiazotropha weberae]ODB89130.1 hypothetical protein A3193_10115 [Candidatus Thiodiazotropha endoloripes]
MLEASSLLLKKTVLWFRQQRDDGVWVKTLSARQAVNSCQYDKKQVIESIQKEKIYLLKPRKWMKDK